MKKERRNSSDLAYERDEFFLLFANGGEVCCDITNSDIELKEYDIAIEEYEELLYYAVLYNDKKQIKQLRGEIQHLKVEKRNIKRMMKNRMEPALT